MHAERPFAGRAAASACAGCMHLHSRDKGLRRCFQALTRENSGLCNKPIPCGVVSFAPSHEPGKVRRFSMKVMRKLWPALPAFAAVGMAASMPAAAQQQQQQQQKPNILFIMGDDIGWMQPRIYHRGLMVGETPNIDRIGNEGAIFMDYVAMQSCTSG